MVSTRSHNPQTDWLIPSCQHEEGSQNDDKPASTILQVFYICDGLVYSHVSATGEAELHALFQARHRSGSSPFKFGTGDGSLNEL
jgi:hypothetical protein